MDNPIVDFSFIYEMAEDDHVYIYEVVGLYLDTLEKGLVKLDELINNSGSMDEIRKQSHFLKSSSSIVKVRGMKDGLFEMEELAREGKDRDKIVALLATLKSTFVEAKPVLKAEIKKNKPSK